MGDSDAFDKLRASARARAKAQRVLEKAIEAEHAELRAAAAGRERERGIFARLAKVTGWSDEYVRRVVKSHDATPD